jgi:predicted anti-sigma-YlaC factor YlaD
MKGCRAIRPMLEAHIYKTLDKAESSKVIEHLQECDTCRTKHEELLRNANSVTLNTNKNSSYINSFGYRLVFQ